MTQPARGMPRDALRGIASGVFFMAFFGTLWATIGVGGVAGWGGAWPTVAALLIGVTLLGGGVSLWRGSGRLDDAAKGVGAGDRPDEGRWFGIIFGLEGASIVVASAVCSATGHAELFFPIMALIVGIHFFPLAWLFGVGTHCLTGALLCAVGLIGLLAVPVTAMLGDREIMARALVVGGGCAIILWGTGLLLWVRGVRLLRRALRA